LTSVRGNGPYTIIEVELGRSAPLHIQLTEKLGASRCEAFE
jgi:hypothetical protein